MPLYLPDLKSILTQSGFVSQTDFDSAQKTASELDKPVTDILIFRGLMTEEAIGQLVAEHFKVPFIQLKDKSIPYEILITIPEQTATAFHIIPFEKDETTLHLAMINPHDIEAIEFVKRRTNLNLKVYYFTLDDFNKTIGQYKKNIQTVFKSIIEENIQKTKGVKIEEAEKAAGELPVIKILDTILEYANAEGASDVHIEALETGVIIRFRVDGILHDILNLPYEVHAALVARIKILTSLKIDEHRIPQDGRFKIKIKESYVALRVSILPAFFGENVVMRLLPETTRPLSLEELGITGAELNLIKDNISKSHGMILVTGPTGSGKTTTLYSVLNMLNTPEVKICTIEDPVEYGIKRVVQTQVNALAGLNFAAGLRSLLRHDPDIIMIGEIRDSETAEIAIHSALTGHLVLSTLHTNSAAGAIPRFLDMGAQGFLLASTINVIVAQRLVRKVCQVCIKKRELSPEMIEIIKEYFHGGNLEHLEFFSAQGCSECNNTGYKGRIGIYEILTMSPKIKDLIVKKATIDEINLQAKHEGMLSLMQDGLNKASAGFTTIEEILRVTRE